MGIYIVSSLGILQAVAGGLSFGYTFVSFIPMINSSNEDVRSWGMCIFIVNRFCQTVSGYQFYVGSM